MSAPFLRVGVLGAGSWGTALAQTIAQAGRDVMLWCRRREQAVGINSRQENADYLAGVTLDRRIRATADPAALAECSAFLCVAPAQHARAALEQIRPYMAEGAPVVMCSKGIERGTLKLMSEVLAEVAPDARAAALSGPSFAHEVAAGLPAAVTLACHEPALGRALMATIGRPQFRPYLTDDLIGAEAGGAVKNVLAIACGIVAGRKLGESAHAAMVTRGFAEMTRFAAALGGRRETLQGLCGLGDLVLTCSSLKSRNMSLGHALGQNQRLKDIMLDRKGVTEGVTTAPVIVGLAERLGVEMPICAAVNDVLNHRASVDQAIEGLLSRPFKVEMA